MIIVNNKEELSFVLKKIFFMKGSNVCEFYGMEKFVPSDKKNEFVRKFFMQFSCGLNFTYKDISKKTDKEFWTIIEKNPEYIIKDISYPIVFNETYVHDKNIGVYIKSIEIATAKNMNLLFDSEKYFKENNCVSFFEFKENNKNKSLSIKPFSTEPFHISMEQLEQIVINKKYCIERRGEIGDKIYYIMKFYGNKMNQFNNIYSFSRNNDIMLISQN